jgi:hypothetical protein
MKISGQRTIKAPADAVWRVLAHEFDRIGEWATPIATSRQAASAQRPTDAPVEGRVCSIALRMFPEVEERVIAYDAAGRTLTYEPVRGMPSFLAVARNRWKVTSNGHAVSSVRFEATVVTRGALGRAFGVVLRPWMWRAGRMVLSDLAHYLEHGTPSPRKRRQLERASRGSWARRRSWTAP